MPSCVIEVMAPECAELTVPAAPVVESVKLLPLTLMVPADPLVALVRLRVCELPEVMTDAVTPRLLLALALLMASANPASVWLSDGAETDTAVPPPTLIEMLPVSTSFAPIEDVVVAMALAGCRKVSADCRDCCSAAIVGLPNHGSGLPVESFPSCVFRSDMTLL